MGRYGPSSGGDYQGRNSRSRNDQSDDFFEERKRQRERKDFSIWAGIPSPPPMKKKVKKEKTPSPSSEDERRRRRKSKRRSKSSRRSHKKKSSKKSSKKNKKSRRKRRPHSRSESDDSESDVSVASERKTERKLSVDSRSCGSDVDEKREATKFKEAVQGSRNDEEEDDEIGPKPLLAAEETAASSLNYGKALLPGEGAAIAQFVQKNMRIPRRGEVGWNGEEIENLENLGYVMSGSRHKRMNAVRIRKENQVYTAEEKRALALINFEEKQQRENAIMNDFKEMLTDRLTKKHGSRLVEDMESSAKD
ncbi:NKAP family protein [Phytophthora ramorum]|uniref:NKAP family protein n=1 Tax=Phytophthora ramorum TaxID=164328 RepID=UPI00309B111D|nr:NKAP family protein [Phytophthora ramorum]